MPRTVSLAAMRSAMAQETNEVWLVLLDVANPGFSTVRLVNNTEAVTSGGNTYQPFPFDIQLPSDEADREPAASITVANVDQSLIDEIRSVTTPITITLRVVLASSPNTVEYGPVVLDCRSVAYDAQKITFTLSFEAFAGEPLGHVAFTPEFFPGIFA